MVVSMMPERRGRPSRRPEPEVLLSQARAAPSPVTTLSWLTDLVVTALNVLSLTEQVLEEALYQLRVMRPVVVDVGTVHRAWHLDPLFRTVDQIQKSASALSFVWAPIAAVRGVIVIDRTKPEVLPAPDSPPAAPPDPDGPVRQLVAFGGRVVDRAETMLPGAGLARQIVERVLGGAGETGDPEPEEELEEEPPAQRSMIELRFDPIEISVPRMTLRTPSVSIRIPSIGVAIPAMDLRLPSWPRVRRY